MSILHSVLLAGVFAWFSNASFAAGACPSELAKVFHQVFAFEAQDRVVTILSDLLDEPTPTSLDRNLLAAEWARALRAELKEKEIRLVYYRAVKGHNVDLPAEGYRCPEGLIPPPKSVAAAESAGCEKGSLKQAILDSQVVIALTQFSTTRPLSNLAKVSPSFRAATMPLFDRALIPMMNVDFVRVVTRCEALREVLDRSRMAEVVFEIRGIDGSRQTQTLRLDLRGRKAVTSTGVATRMGMVKNFPSGETYITPYEGKQIGRPSRTQGVLPVQFGDEIVLYEVMGGRAIRVISTGEKSRAEAVALEREPGYGNMAELGLGVLDPRELAKLPLAHRQNLLIVEKYGPHIGIGANDHLEGTFGPLDFLRPENAMHIDRVYIQQMQPRVSIRSLVTSGYTRNYTIITDGQYNQGFD